MQKPSQNLNFTINEHLTAWDLAAHANTIYQIRIYISDVKVKTVRNAPNKSEINRLTIYLKHSILGKTNSL